jgi:hypothetical protein
MKSVIFEIAIMKSDCEKLIYFLDTVRVIAVF